MMALVCDWCMSHAGQGYIIIMYINFEGQPGLNRLGGYWVYIDELTMAMPLAVDP